MTVVGGFTLLETVLAIGLFAIVAVGAATAMKTAGDLAWDIHVAEEEANSARSVLEEVFVRRRSQGDQNSRIELEDGTVAHWEVEPADLASDEGLVLSGLVRLVIQISRPGKPAESYEVLAHESP